MRLTIALGSTKRQMFSLKRGESDDARLRLTKMHEAGGRPSIRSDIQGGLTLCGVPFSQSVGRSSQGFTVTRAKLWRTALPGGVYPDPVGACAGLESNSIPAHTHQSASSASLKPFFAPFFPPHSFRTINPALPEYAEIRT